MVILIALLVAIVISVCWYMPGIRAQGGGTVLRTGDYLRAALLYGFLFTCLLIVVTEIAWDRIIGDRIPAGLLKEILSDFFRAALLEEAFKFLGFLKAKKKLALTRRIDYVMIAGLMGLVYGIWEKIMHGSIAAVIVGLLVPMHMMWQFNQGDHYYDLERAKLENDPVRIRRERIAVFLVPFLFHGAFDSILDIGAWMLDRETLPLQILGFLLLTGIVAAGAVYAVRTVRRVCRIARAESSPQTP